MEACLCQISQQYSITGITFSAVTGFVWHLFKANTNIISTVDVTLTG